MNKLKTSALRDLASVFGDNTQVEHFAAALRTAAEHHTELTLQPLNADVIVAAGNTAP